MKEKNIYLLYGREVQIKPEHIVKNPTNKDDLHQIFTEIVIPGIFNPLNEETIVPAGFVRAEFRGMIEPELKVLPPFKEKKGTND